MTLNTVHGKVTTTPGTFNSGWFLLKKQSIPLSGTATDEIPVVWKDYSEDVNAVRVELRNLSFATLTLPNSNMVLSTDGGTTFNVTSYIYQTITGVGSATVEKITNSIGISASVQMNSASTLIPGATGGGTPGTLDMTVEILKTNATGGIVPFRWWMQWLSTSTLALHQEHGSGFLALTSPVAAMRIKPGNLIGGAVEVYGLQSKADGFPV